MDAGTIEHGRHSTSSPAPGSEVPRASLGALGLELEQVPGQRARGLRSRSRCGRLRAGTPLRVRPESPARLAAIPALEQAAERERRSLACTELGRQPPRREIGRSVLRGARPTNPVPASGSSPCSLDRHIRMNRSDSVEMSTRTSLPRPGYGGGMSDLDHDRQDHRPPPGAVVDELSDCVVHVLLEQLDLRDPVRRQLLGDPLRLVAHLVE